MATENRYIIHIANTWANLDSGGAGTQLGNQQIGITTDNIEDDDTNDLGFHGLVYRDDGGTTHKVAIIEEDATFAAIRCDSVTVSGTAAFSDATLEIQDDGDSSKVAQFECSSIPASTSNVYTFPAASGTLATLNLQGDITTGGYDFVIPNATANALEIMDSIATTQMIFNTSTGVIEIHRNLQLGGNDITIPDDTADAFSIKEGANAYITIDTTDGDEAINIYLAGTGAGLISKDHTLLGKNAGGASGTNNTCIGISAGASIQVNGNYNTCIGKDSGDAITTGDYQTLVGQGSGGAIDTGIANSAFGYNSGGAITSGKHNVCIGYVSGQNITTGQYCIMLGDETSVDDGLSLGRIAIGYQATCTEDNQCVIGGAEANGYSAITRVYIGRGVTDSHATNITISPTAGSGDNMAGNDFTIAGGQSTGTGVGGDINLQISPAGGAGSSLNALETKVQIRGDEEVWIGDIGGGNYSKTESDGTMVFIGDATVWDDVNIGTLQLGSGNTRPDTVEITATGGAATGIYTLGFDVGEEVSSGLELEHRYKEGSDITPHVHWSGNAAPTGTDKVKWQLEYSVCPEEGLVPAATTITVETDYDTQYESKRSDFPAITGTNFDIGDQFMFTLSRIAASTDEYGGDALTQTIGVHIQIDTVGSRQIVTK